MGKIEDIHKNKELLTDTNTDLLTPLLGNGSHLVKSYHRVQFIAKVIEYMVYLSYSYGIEKVHGRIIIDALANTSWYLRMSPSQSQLEKLLIEMSLGLELLEIEDMGSIKIPIDIDNKNKISILLGRNFRLSPKGWESYRKQEYQILASDLYAARISRLVSYVAIIIALLTLFVSIYSGGSRVVSFSLPINIHSTLFPKL